MLLSYIILTHNRRQTLLRTLRVLVDSTPLASEQWEAIVVDNASEDGTVAAVEREHGGGRNVRLVRRQRNEGSPARNAGARVARGEYLIFLDDDSYPTREAVTRSIAYMQQHRRVGIVVGRVLLPDGREDAAALPIVAPACAMCVRREAFLAIGGFSTEFFQQVEQYDLTFRMFAAGWDVRRVEGIVYHHEYAAESRDPALAQALNLRNNLVLAARFLPQELRRQYQHDWLRRYVAIARHGGNAHVVGEAIADARRVCVRERKQRQILDAAMLEVIFQHGRQARRVRAWAEAMLIRSVVIADLSKNVYATWRACQVAGLEVMAIAEEHPAFATMRYRGIDIISEERAAELKPDGVVLSNINPGLVRRRSEALVDRFSCPVLHLWEPGSGEHALEAGENQDQWRSNQQPRLAV